MQDGPQFMAEEAKLFNYPFPYLFDEVRTLSSIDNSSQISVATNVGD